MKKIFTSTTLLSFLLLFSLVLVGCNTTKIETSGELHDDVLVYNAAYDLIFLRVMQAADTLNDWQVEITDKEEGLIRFHNLNFSAFSDAGERTATVYLKRISRQETSVQLAPESQRVLDAPKILKAIDYSVNK